MSASYERGRNIAPFMDDSDDGIEPRDNDLAAQTTDELLARACELDDAIEERTAESIAPLKAELDEIKDVLKARAVAAGSTLSNNYGRVEYVKASERVTWDDASLLLIVARLAESQPELCAQIIACRRANAVEPTARVRFAVRGA